MIPEEEIEALTDRVLLAPAMLGEVVETEFGRYRVVVYESRWVGADEATHINVTLYKLDVPGLVAFTVGGR